MKILARWLERLILLSSAVFACACAVRQPAYPYLSGTLFDKTQQNNLAAALSEKAGELKSLRLLCDMTLEEKGRFSRMREVIVFEKPQRLRLESFPGTSFLSLNLSVIDGEKGVFLESLEHKAFVTEDAGKLLRRFYKIPIEPADLIGIISGRLPEREIAALRQPGVYEVRDDQEAGKILIMKSNGAVVWVVDKGTLLLREASFQNIFDDSTALRVVLGDFVNADGVSLPSKQRFEVDSEGLNVEFLVQTWKVNQAIPGTLFEVKIPDDYVVERVR